MIPLKNCQYNFNWTSILKVTFPTHNGKQLDLGWAKLYYELDGWKIPENPVKTCNLSYCKQKGNIKWSVNLILIEPALNGCHAWFTRVPHKPND